MGNLTLLDYSKLAWRRDPATKDGEAVYRRLLGPTELGFYWDVHFNGVGVAITRAEVEVEGSDAEEIFAEQSLEAAWVRLKQRHPLLAASADDSRGGDSVELVIDERSLIAVRPGEVTFLALSSEEEADKFIDKLQNEPYEVDLTILSRVWIVSTPGTPFTRRIYVSTQHHITDGMGNASITRGYCQEISTPSKDIVVTGLEPLSERLERIQPSETFTPGSRHSLPRRRWRLAIAKVMSELPRNKPQGGHTLPKLDVPDDKRVVIPALSRTFHASPLSAAVSSQIFRTCRALGITFGNALPVLSQLAHTRILHRLHHQGKIDAEDWAYRRTQPMHFTGPINLRPYLDRSWYQSGGEHEVLLAIGFWNTTLPLMPFSSVAEEDGTPPFASLLSHERFLYRARLAKDQQTQKLKHPLLHESHELRMPNRVRSTRVLTERWQAQLEGREYVGNEAHFGGSFRTMGTCVFSNGGSSLGNRDKLIPLEYPLAPAPLRLRIVNYRSALRCRPTELYLGAVTSHGQLRFYAHFDANLFGEEVVREWAEEVRAATVHYLGGEV